MNVNPLCSAVTSLFKRVRQWDSIQPLTFPSSNYLFPVLITLVYIMSVLLWIVTLPQITLLEAFFGASFTFFLSGPMIRALLFAQNLKHTTHRFKYMRHTLPRLVLIELLLWVDVFLHLLPFFSIIRRSKYRSWLEAVEDPHSRQEDVLHAIESGLAFGHSGPLSPRGAYRCTQQAIRHGAFDQACQIWTTAPFNPEWVFDRAITQWIELTEKLQVPTGCHIQPYLNYAKSQSQISLLDALHLIIQSGSYHSIRKLQNPELSRAVAEAQDRIQSYLEKMALVCLLSEAHPPSSTRRSRAI